jgi:hypothetical protein
VAWLSEVWEGLLSKVLGIISPLCKGLGVLSRSMAHREVVAIGVREALTTTAMRRVYAQLLLGTGSVRLTDAIARGALDVVVTAEDMQV